MKDTPESVERPLQDPANARRLRSMRVLVTLIAIVAVTGALRLTAAVTLPLTFAIFVIALCWPVYRWVEDKLFPGVAALSAMVVFLGFVGVVGYGVWMAIDRVVEAGTSTSGNLSKVADDARGWAKSHGLPVPGGNGGGDLQELFKRSGRLTLDVVGGFVLVIAFLVLGLLEVRDYKQRVQNGLGLRTPDRWLCVLERIAKDFRRYFVVRTGIGLLTGVATALVCWIIGLKYPVVWGIINFLLNYVPTLGSIAGVLPPTLFAIVQFDDLSMALVTLASVGGVQLLMGNYIDPLVQGKYLSLSPMVVLLSVTFWGWVWGAMGALIGVPLTVVTVLLCREFDSTRWIAVMLASSKSNKEVVQPTPPPEPARATPSRRTSTGRA